MGDKKMQPRRCCFPITCHLSLVTLLLLAGCGGQTVQTFYSERDAFEANYVTFEHPFTDAGAEDARKRAAAQCAQRKQSAVKTTSACSFSRCTTSFQCMAPADAARYQTGREKK
jgi:hypothetical protein